MNFWRGRIQHITSDKEIVPNISVTIFYYIFGGNFATFEYGISAVMPECERKRERESEREKEIVDI